MPRPEDVNMAHDTCLSWHACAERISTSTAVDCVNVPTGKMSSSRWYWCGGGVGVERMTREPGVARQSSNANPDGF